MNTAKSVYNEQDLEVEENKYGTFIFYLHELMCFHCL